MKQQQIQINIVFWFYCLTCFIGGCSSHREGNESENMHQEVSFINQYQLKPIGEKVFTIDTLTSSDKVWVTLYHNKDSRILYLLSHLDFSLQAYDWDNGKLLYKRKLAQEGPNGVGRPFSLYVMSEDSIYVLSPYDYKVNLIDSKGNVLKRYSLYEGSSSVPLLGSGVLALSNSASQISIIDNKFIVGGSPNDDCKKQSFYTTGKTGVALNLINGKVDYLMNMPSVFADRYGDGFALSGQQTFFGQTYNPNTKTAIINFPTENYLYEVNINTKQVNRHYTASKIFEKIEYGKKDLTDVHKEYQYWAKQPNFPSVFYDPYNKMYIRFVATPNLKKSNIYDGSDGEPLFNLSLILLNEDFKTVGEQKLGKNYWESEAFIAPDGLYLLKYTGDETKLTYTRFKISKSNETTN